ncbi:hypothetical protein SWPG_00140 [Synechococcus phage S-CBM2]|nr:hypothetical protein SWPG_00140 [Synechococcus phage S-CBM2]
MSIFSNIKNKTKGAGKSETWYRKEFHKAVSTFGQSRPQVGDLYYFHYIAFQPERMEWYDRYPMAYCLSVDETGWLGVNFHYLHPDSRMGTVNQILDTTSEKDLFFPKSMLHRYRYVEQKSPLYNLPRTEWDSVKLPLEYFVDESPLAPNGGRKIPGKRVWGN